MPINIFKSATNFIKDFVEIDDENKPDKNIDPALNQRLIERGINQKEINTFFKAPSTGEILKTEAKAIGSAIKTTAKSEVKKTKESLPYLKEAVKDTDYLKSSADWWKGTATSLGKSAVNVLEAINKTSPTFGIDKLKDIKKGTTAGYEKTKELLAVTPKTKEEKIAVGGGEVTGDFIKFALLDKAMTSILSPLAKTKIVLKPGVTQHIFEDAAMKADYNKLPEIASLLRKVKTVAPATLEGQVRAITEISAKTNSIPFKKQLLGSISELVNYSSSRMLKEAATDKAVATLYNSIKELPQAAKMAANIGSFVALGQIDYEPGEEARYERALKDLAIGVGFEGAAVLAKKLSPVAKVIYNDLKSGVKVSLKEAELLSKEIKNNQAGFAKLPGKVGEKPSEKYAFNINLDRLGLKGDARKQAEESINAVKGELEKVKGSPVTEAEIAEGMKNADILQKAIPREETVAFAEKLTNTRQRVVEITEALPKIKDTATREKLIKEQADLWKILSSEAADKGRSLRSFRYDVSGEEGNYLDKVIAKLSKLGNDSDELAKKAAQIDPTDSEAVEKLFREFEKPSFTDVLQEFRYNNVLSNPRTFERNLFSNIVQTFITRPATKLVDALIGGQTKFKELPLYYKGLAENIGQAASDFKDVFTGKINIGQQDLKKIPTGKLPKIFRVPTLALEATDRFLTRLIAGGEMAAGKSAKEAEGIAAYSLFRTGIDETGKSGQGWLLSKVDKATAAVDGMRKKFPGAGWFVLFLKTPMNIAKQWIEYSPAGLATLPGNARKSEQIAKMLIGSSVTAYGASLAMEDRTTWGIPNDPELRDLFYAQGKKPYSIKIGDKWVPMQYFGPAGLSIALPAAFKYYQDESKTSLTDTQFEKGLRTLYGAFELFTNQTFMESLGSMVTAINSEENKLREMVKSGAFTAGQAIPWNGMMRWISTIVDPVYRKADGFIEAIERDIPFMSQNLESYKTPTGEESKREGYNLFTPYDITKNKDEYNDIFNYRREQLQINNLLKQDTDAIKKEAVKLMDDFDKAKTDEESNAIAKKLSENKALRNTFVNMLKKQAMYVQSTIQPIYYFKDSPSDIADIIYGRMIIAETDEDVQTKVVDFIKQLKEAGLYNASVGTALKKLIEKGNEADNIEEQQSATPTSSEEENPFSAF